MKHLKIVTAWLLLTAALLLSGCAAGSEAAYSIEDAQTLLDAGVLDGELAPLNVSGSIIASIYGIGEDTLVEFASYHAMNSSVSADEVTVFVLTGAEAAQAAEAAFQTYVANQIETCRNYCPAALPRLDAAVIRRSGSTVLLAVGDPDLLPAEVNALHK